MHLGLYGKLDKVSLANALGPYVGRRQRLWGRWLACVPTKPEGEGLQALEASRSIINKSKNAPLPSIFVSYESCDILQDTGWPLIPGDDGQLVGSCVGDRDHCRSHGVGFHLLYARGNCVQNW